MPQLIPTRSTQRVKLLRVVRYEVQSKQHAVRERGGKVKRGIHCEVRGVRGVRISYFVAGLRVTLLSGHDRVRVSSTVTLYHRSGRVLVRICIYVKRYNVAISTIPYYRYNVAVSLKRFETVRASCEADLCVLVLFVNKYVSCSWPTSVSELFHSP